MRALFVVLSVLFVGCASDAPMRGRISSKIPEECIQNIIAAEAFWADSTGHESVIDLRITDDESDPGYREIVFRPYDNDNDLLGYTTWNMRVNFETKDAIVRLRGECTFHTAAHELGHAWRLDHSVQRDDLMRDDLDDAGFDISAEQLEKALRSIGHEI